jgi:hypothetical protein
MPDFELDISGASVANWLDPANGEQPSRLNLRMNRNAKRFLGVVGVTIWLRAIVEGSFWPLDTELEGRLFVALSVEAPHPYPVPFTQDTGRSSAQAFVPTLPGHYLLGMRRQVGGVWYVHIDVEAVT